ncbi:MAG: hypothetical protein H7A30_07015 [Thermotogae bacterium]|nr:hypothetical protein [Thermotogota bacterium]
MEYILVFIDGTICDTRHRNNIQVKKDFFSEKNIIDDIPTKGSIETLKRLSVKYGIIYIGARDEKYREATQKWLKKNNFPDGEIYLGSSVEERLEIVKKLKENLIFTAGIGDRWDDNLLHLEIGCKSFILEEYNPDWSVVEKYI